MNGYYDEDGNWVSLDTYDIPKTLQYVTYDTEGNVVGISSTPSVGDVDITNLVGEHFGSATGTSSDPYDVKFYRDVTTGVGNLGNMGGAGTPTIPSINISDPSSLTKAADFFKNIVTGGGSVADYGTLLAGAMGLYEYLNRDKGPKAWEGQVKKGAYLPPVVNPQYTASITKRGYGQAAIGQNPFVGGEYIAPIAAATPTAAAQGGLMGLAKSGASNPPRYLRGETDGMADQLPSSIDGKQPAKLSHGEFVVPADVVSHLGNGNSDAGAKVLYKMMDRVRQARTGNKRQGKQIKPEKFMPGGIADIPRYSGGGAVAFNVGGTAGTTSSTTGPSIINTTTAQGLAPWVGDYVAGPQGFLSKAWALGDQPYQAYQGPLSAGTSPLQQQYFSGLGSMGFPSDLGTSFTSQGIASQYMNPYLSAALQPQLDEIRRQADISRMKLGAKFGGAGGGASAFGGARQGIESAELERSMLGEMGKTLSSGYATAYDKAREQFNTEQLRKRAQAEMLESAGKTQQQAEQTSIDAQIKQFQEAQQWPYKQLEFQQRLLGGLPIGTSTYTPATSGFSDLVSGIGGLLSLRKQLGG